ncbi:radical SAM protein [Geobacter pickeringii]|uniref:radical SAM protein n=1 Tax=Geobacter pickeringii TaxID=345632 RepID=UPI00068C1DAF|nr:radical SAM protein [Geobacter pickeringii]
MTRALKLLRILWRMHRKAPTFVSFNVSDRCNEACPMCAVWREPGPELPVPELERIFADLGRFGLMVVEVSGGEPFLRSDIFEVFALLDRLGFLYTTTTNGTIVTDEILGRLRRAEGLLQLAVSLDSLDRAVYARLRGGDLLPQVLRNLDTIAAAALPRPVKLNLTLGRHNVREALELLRFARERGFYLSVFPVNTGHGFAHRAADPLHEASAAEREEMAALFRELARLRRAGEPLWEYSGFYELAADYVLGKGGGLCDAGELYVDLRTEGRLAVCVDQPAFADLRRESVAAAWPRIAGERERIRQCAGETPCCYTCTANVSLTAGHQLSFLLETARVRWRRRREGRQPCR